MTLNEIGHDGRVDNVRILQRLSGGQEAKKPRSRKPTLTNDAEGSSPLARTPPASW